MMKMMKQQSSCHHHCHCRRLRHRRYTEEDGWTAKERLCVSMFRCSPFTLVYIEAHKKIEQFQLFHYDLVAWCVATMVPPVYSSFVVSSSQAFFSEPFFSFFLSFISFFSVSFLRHTCHGIGSVRRTALTNASNPMNIEHYNANNVQLHDN